jgi:MYXO-CTERM domain-containing protein
MVPVFGQTPADRPATAPSAAGSGQTVPGTDMNSPSRNDYSRDRDDHGFNFGWLGLVGLAGLLGMRRNPNRHEGTRYDEPRSVDNTGPGGIR